MDAATFTGPQHTTHQDSSSSHADGSLPSRELDHVLVPLDGSDFSLAAMPTARALAERFSAELHTIDVVGSGPGEAVARRALELGSSVVCLSTRPRGRIAGAFAPSLASTVLRDSPGPIVAVGPLAERPGWHPEPQGWLTPLSATEIVACVDGGDESEAVLAEAIAWAHALSKSLTILTVIDDAPEPLRPRDNIVDHRTRHGAERYVSALVDRWNTSGVEVSGLVLRDPIGPASAIRNHLARRPAALVALAAPDRSGFHRLRCGATADKIVRTSPAPCLVVSSGWSRVNGSLVAPEPDASPARAVGIQQQGQPRVVGINQTTGRPTASPLDHHPSKTKDP